METISAIRFFCMILFVVFGWEGVIVSTLASLLFGAVAFRIAYRLGQRSVAGITPKQYARMRKVREKLEEEAEV